MDQTMDQTQQTMEQIQLQTTVQIQAVHHPGGAGGYAGGRANRWLTMQVEEQLYLISGTKPLT